MVLAIKVERTELSKHPAGDFGAEFHEAYQTW